MGIIRKSCKSVQVGRKSGEGRCCELVLNFAKKFEETASGVVFVLPLDP